MKVRARPYKSVHLCEHDPRAFAVEIETLFDGTWDFERQVRIGRRRMHDGKHCHQLAARVCFGHEDNGAWPVLHAFLAALKMLGMPEIGIANDKAGYQNGRFTASIFHFLVQVRVLIGHFCFGNRSEVFVRRSDCNFNT